MKRGSLRELVLIVVVALGLALLIQALVVKPYRIPSESMEPTLDIGQRVLVDRIGNRFTDPSVGDIVVFKPPAGAEQPFGEQCGSPPPEGQVCIEGTPEKADTTFIKRVVAGPGDRIRIDDGHVSATACGRASRSPCRAAAVRAAPSRAKPRCRAASTS